MTLRRSPRSRVATLACALLALLSLAYAADARAAVGDFHTLADSPVPLTSVAIDPTTNLIYAQADGGTTFYSYDPRTNAWTPLTDAPINSGNNGGAAYLGGKIYTVYTNNSTDLAVYDIASGTWTTTANPLGDGTGDITAVGDSLYLVNSNTFVRYTPSTNTTTPLADPPGSGFQPWGGLQAYRGKIYGHEGNGNAGFYSYDIGSNTWTTLADVSTASDTGAVLGSALDPTSGTYFTYGNYGGDTFYRYDIAGGAWDSVTLPFSIDDGGMAYLDLPGVYGVYAIQGESGTGFVRYETVAPDADLALANSVDAGSATVGQQLTYTIGVSNNGPANAYNAVVTDTLPPNVTFVSSSASRGTCSGTTTVTCSLGRLANGDNATVRITVTASSAGTAANTASVGSDTRDSSTGNNSATASTTVAAAPATTPQPRPKPKVRCIVPKLRGKTLSQATRALHRHHCRVGTVKRVRNNRTGRYEVRSQAVRAGRRFARGHRVRVTLARVGPVRVAPAPEFTG